VLIQKATRTPVYRCGENVVGCGICGHDISHGSESQRSSSGSHLLHSASQSLMHFIYCDLTALPQHACKISKLVVTIPGFMSFPKARETVIKKPDVECVSYFQLDILLGPSLQLVEYSSFLSWLCYRISL
jgi:hypothetical protein